MYLDVCLDTCLDLCLDTIYALRDAFQICTSYMSLDKSSNTYSDMRLRCV
ncbi:hypothetical protein GCM10008014_36980 [Paenibacillus silvae]|uniref:Uncharacterized protein n=1 Tax=Paenibacillus silvae TaxID=1325358 RepID=A0ABQ1ZHV5_9BACL|nr:hypothetical protein GCM10008014_36980 [Paenibacillus silvae]